MQSKTDQFSIWHDIHVNGLRVTREPIDDLKVFGVSKGWGSRPRHNY